VHSKPLKIDVPTYNAFKKILKNNSRLGNGPPGFKNPLELV